MTEFRRVLFRSSGVSMLGIALGVAALIIVLSVMNGFQKEVTNRGVGKKILAKKIHAWSARKGGCVIASCSALNEAQLDRELFSSKGLMIQANGGTLIIDDIANTTPHIQTKILRALVGGEMMTVDTDQKIALNVRIIATSKICLKKLVEEGKFKEELFYRLNTVALRIPALRERQDDVKVMAEFFFKLSFFDELLEADL